LYGWEIYFFAVREESKLNVSKNKVSKETFEPKRQEDTEVKVKQTRYTP
jgi:hypothetical protein